VKIRIFERKIQNQLYIFANNDFLHTDLSFIVYLIFDAVIVNSLNCILQR